MKYLSETKALDVLHSLKTEFAYRIRNEYEHRAKSCLTCETPGACCLDAHFVNVRITRLEANAIKQRLRELPDEIQLWVAQRIERTIEKYGLTDPGDTFSKTYTCPLFEKGIGCLVHEYGKPLPCIAHACYERKEDIPPDELLAEQEIKIDKLNRRTYGESSLSSLPIAIQHLQKPDR